MELIRLQVFMALNGFRFNDFWENLNTAGKDVIGKMQLIAPIGAALALAICGLMFFMGKRGAEAAKPWMMNIMIGLVIVFSAISIATWASDTTKF